MRAYTVLTSVIPGLLLVLVFVAGLVLVARRSGGTWRSLSLAGLGVLLSATLVNMVLTLSLVTGSYRFRVGLLFGLVGLFTTVLNVIGTGLLIASVLSGRGASEQQLGRPPGQQPGQQPGPQQPAAAYPPPPAP